MDLVTRADSMLDYQMSRLVKEQQKTNELLQQLLDTLKPPVKEVEKVEPVRYDSVNKQEHRRRGGDSNSRPMAERRSKPNGY